MKRAIHLEGVSKQFIIHHERNRSFQEIFVNLVRRQSPESEVFWALRDVSFTLQQGDSLAVVGANGAGKSTLLKIITQIISPSSGLVSIDGRISALLELGAGFHPELSGRDNIFLNASLLGLKHKVIKAKLDDIIAFAELEKFIDTPVKHYSSGMYARLGFAIAINIDPDILIIDEILAVGDMAFQRKCLDKISEFRRSGQTMIFVSHDLNSARNLCKQALWLEHGRVKQYGPAFQVVDAYLASSNAQTQARIEQEAQSWHATSADSPENQEREAPYEIAAQNGATQGRSIRVIDQSAPQPIGVGYRYGSREVEITGVEFLDRNGYGLHTFYTGEPLTVRIHYQAHEPIESPVFGVAINRSDGQYVAGPTTKFAGYILPTLCSEGYVDYTIPKLPLLEGLYLFSTVISDNTSTHPFDHHEQAYKVVVQQRGLSERLGFVAIPATWAIVPLAPVPTQETTAV